MKILYLPLDERPCNYLFPGSILSKVEHTLIQPDKNLLGKKKKEASIDVLQQWLSRNIGNADAAVISIEMLIYGGLIPSRTHQLPLETLLERLNFLCDLKSLYSETSFYLFSLVMRCPARDGDDEEPFYYKKYGKSIFDMGVAINKNQPEMKPVNISQEILDDYIGRRKKNFTILKKVVQKVKLGEFEYLSIPQDDSAEFGFSRMDRVSILREIGTYDNILSYPGADEAGCSLLARSILDQSSNLRKIYILWSSDEGQSVIPRYEDQSLEITIKMHIKVAGADLAESIDQADYILAVNVPQGKTRDAGLQNVQFQDEEERDTLLQEKCSCFVERLKPLLEGNVPLALADLRFTDGGDLQLLDKLEKAGLIGKLKFYGAWNTCGNTLGHVIADLLVSEGSLQNIRLRILEDGLYMSSIRQYIHKAEFPDDNDPQKDAILESIANRAGLLLKKEGISRFPSLFNENSLIKVEFPWNRRFEIEVKVLK